MKDLLTRIPSEFERHITSVRHVDSKFVEKYVVLTEWLSRVG